MKRHIAHPENVDRSLCGVLNYQLNAQRDAERNVFYYDYAGKFVEVKETSLCERCLRSWSKAQERKRK